MNDFKALGSLTKAVFETNANSVVIDAVRRLEAECLMLKREFVNSQREGELLGLTMALALCVSLPPDKAIAEIRAIIDRLSYEV